MKRPYNGEVQHCLNELDKMLYDSLQPWWDRLAHHVVALQQDLHFHILPLATLAAYTVQGVERAQALGMANIFRTLYLSNYIHRQVRDEKEGQVCDQALQQDILLGDYLFGHLIQLLLDVQAEELLDDFSQLICTLNEGYTQEYLDPDHEKLRLKNNVHYYISAFQTAARLGGDRDLGGFAEIGASFGRTLAFLAEESASTPIYSRIIGELLKELGQRRKEAVLRLGQLGHGFFPDDLLFAVANA